MCPRTPQVLARCVQIAGQKPPIPAGKDLTRSACTACRDCPGTESLSSPAVAPASPAVSSLPCGPLRKLHGTAARQMPTARNSSAVPDLPAQFPRLASPDFLRRHSASPEMIRLRSQPQLFLCTKIFPVVLTYQKTKSFRLAATILGLPIESPTDSDPLGRTCLPVNLAAAPVEPGFDC